MKISIIIFLGLFCLVRSHSKGPSARYHPPTSTLYESEWVVELHAGLEPGALEEHGFEVLGPVGTIDDLYLVRHKETQSRHLRSDAHKYVPSKEVTTILQNHPHVKDAEQQYFKRARLAFQDPLFVDQWNLVNTGQFDGIAGVDVSIQGAWSQGYTGKGVRIAFVDTGLQSIHPDIADRFQADSSYSFINPIGPDPNPTYDDPHGTMVAGIALAANNSICVVGAAYMAESSGIRAIGWDQPFTDAIQAQSLSYKNQLNDIYSNSWTPYADIPGQEVGGPGLASRAALNYGVKKGRGGLGNIFTFAAGNGQLYGDNTNYNGYANSPLTIAVGAIGNNGKQSYYSNMGASILVVAPSDNVIPTAGIRTLDMIGEGGAGPGDCYSDFGGTSAATPLVAAIVALMLEANPSLTWRDVQVILAKTAGKNDPIDTDWAVNGAGYHVNHKYGYGLANATAAVNAAKSHKNLGAQQVVSTGVIPVNQWIPDYPSIGLKQTFTIESTIKIETVAITIVIDHPTSGDLQMVLTSPSGTDSVLSIPHSFLLNLTHGGNDTYPGVNDTVGPALYGPQLQGAPITGELVHSDPLNACTAIQNCADIEGKIAVANGTTVLDAYYGIYGACNFTTKTKHLQDCGALAVLITSVDETLPWWYQVILNGSDPTITIPTFSVSLDVANTLVDYEIVTVALTQSLLNNYANGWQMTTKRLIDESPNGTWTLAVTDGVQNYVGNFATFFVDVYGHNAVADDGGNIGGGGGGGGGNNTDRDVLIGGIVGGFGLLLLAALAIFVVWKGHQHLKKTLGTCICGKIHGPGGHPHSEESTLTSA